VAELLIPDLYPMEDDLSILGIVLIPTVVESFPSTRQCH